MKSLKSLLIAAAVAAACWPIMAQEAEEPATEPAVVTDSETTDAAPTETVEEAPAAEEEAAETDAPIAEPDAEADVEVTPAEDVGEDVDAEPADEADAELEEDEGDEIMPLIVIDNAPLTDVIKTLARQARLNFMFDPRITAGLDRAGQPVIHPDISIRFENVTAYQALEAVLSNHDLEIVPNETTKIARISYVNPQALPPLLTEVIQLKYAPVTNMVQVIPSTFVDKRGQVIGDARSSKLVVVATETDLKKVHELLTQLDIAPRQVLIEANILETSKNPKSVKGIDWSGTLEAQRFSFGNGNTEGTITRPGGTTSSTTTLPSGRTVTTTSTAQSIESLVTTVGNGGLSMDTANGFSPSTAFLNANGVHAVLSFLNKQNDTKVVATPRTVTMDNEEATLEVTRAFPIFEITPGSANSPAGASITYTNLGTILRVTPRISANSNIALKVVPEVSNIDGQDQQVINDTINQANIYAIRKMHTSVVIPSGNTLVMGGLINDTITKGYTKVPVLGDIPGLGRMFRSDSKERNRQNLLIFITPTVVTDADFQPAESNFLSTKQVGPPPEELLTPWDSARPYKWNKQYWNEEIPDDF